MNATIIHDILSLSDDILFAWDITTKRMEYSAQVLTFFDVPQVVENFPEVITEGDIVVAEDLPIFLAMADNMAKGIIEPTEFRMKTKQGEISFYEIVYKIIFEHGQPQAAIGKIINIDDKKNLLKEVGVDALTGCYNKAQTERMITDFLQSEPAHKQHLFLLVDIDEFKTINDTLGHAFGDTVLSEIGGRLQKIARHDDVVGRIGGDEFVILLKNISNMIAVKNKLAEILHIFRYEFAGKNKSYKVSGSIGIARFSMDGSNFETLYQKADKAMYQAKKAGKDQYCIYTDAYSEQKQKKEALPTRRRNQLEISCQNHVLSQILNMIQSTQDLSATLHMVLKMVGEALNVSRVSIFEYDEKQALWFNTFEWYASGLSSMMQSFTGVDSSVFAKLGSFLTEEKIFLLNDTSQDPSGSADLWKMKEAKAVISGLYFRANKPSFFLAVDDCVQTRTWSPEEYQFIYFLTNIIAPHLIFETVADNNLNMKGEYLKLKKQTDYDSLTGLPSRDKFLENTQKMLQENPDKKFFAMIIDVVKFQMVNSYFGVAEGDRLLKALAEALKANSTPFLGTYGRLSGDRFVACFELRYDLEIIAHKIADDFRRTIKEFNPDYKLRIVTGVCPIEGHSIHRDETYTKLSLAIKECKKHEDMDCCIYTDALLQQESHEKEIANDMHRALLEKQFEVYLQPKVSLSTGALVGAEALCRWNHPERGSISPAEFIPILETHGFITQLDYYIWRETCEIIQQQMAQGIQIPISVNVSVIDMHHQNIVGCFSDLLAEYQIDPQYLHIEISERICTNNNQEIVSVLNGLKALGLTIEMDDFGSGYSSLHMFDTFPIDVLKLDRIFLKDLLDNEKKQHVIQLIINLAKTYGIKVVAEGIETAEQLHFLQNIGCHIGQGYLFLPPVSLEIWYHKRNLSYSTQ